jgi:hypothetical protein
MDRGPENDNAIISKLISTYGIYYIITFAFNPQVNRIIKREYKLIVASLTKATEGSIDN